DLVGPCRSTRRAAVLAFEHGMGKLIGDVRLLKTCLRDGFPERRLDVGHVRLRCENSRCPLKVREGHDARETPARSGGECPAQYNVAAGPYAGIIRRQPAVRGPRPDRVRAEIVL